MKKHPCKIGTIPSLVILKYRYKIKVGKRIIFREDQIGSKWMRGKITQVNDNGYFFVEVE